MSEKLNTFLGIRTAICPCCKKEFIVAVYHRYVIDGKPYCSNKCKNQTERENALKKAKKGKKTLAERNAEIFELYKNGASVEELSERFNVSDKRVRNIIDDLGSLDYVMELKKNDRS